MSGERTPWLIGITTAVIAALMTVAAVGTLGVQLVRIEPLFALAVLAVVIGGAAPAVLRRRRQKVWRWLVYGAAVGAAISLVVTAVAAAW